MIGRDHGGRGIHSPGSGPCPCCYCLRTSSPRRSATRGCPHPASPNHLLGAQPVTGFVNRAISSSPSFPPSSSLPCLLPPPFYSKSAHPLPRLLLLRLLRRLLLRCHACSHPPSASSAPRSAVPTKGQAGDSSHERSSRAFRLRSVRPSMPLLPHIGESGSPVPP